jgi:hypothetical protein
LSVFLGFTLLLSIAISTTTQAATILCRATLYALRAELLAGVEVVGD